MKRNRYAYSLCLCVASLVMMIGTAQCQAAVDALDNVEGVITPTRLKQAIRDVPASVTIITSDMIEQHGFQSIAEALRLVPGMTVLKAAGNDYRIEYHGTNAIIPRRMQLLIDGVSWYRVGFQRIDWATLPVAIEEVDRIEVTRSPSTASYGANSFTSVVNIITKDASIDRNLVMSSTIGSAQTRRVYAAIAKTGENGSARFSFYHNEDAGYDKHIEEDADRRDSQKVQRAILRATYKLPRDTTVFTQFGASDAYLQNEYGDDDQLTYPDLYKTDIYGMIKSTSFLGQHKLEAKLYTTYTNQKEAWRTCVPTYMLTTELKTLFDQNEGYALQIVNGQIPSGGSASDDALAQAAITKIQSMGLDAYMPTCGEINHNIAEKRLDFEVYNTFVFSPRVRLLAGLNLRQDEVASQTFFQGTERFVTVRAFGNVEYRYENRWVANASAMLEQELERNIGWIATPRVGLNYHIAPTITLRLTHAQAVRTPDLLATSRNWHYIPTDLDPPFEGRTTQDFFYTAKAMGNLTYEHIRSNEVGLYIDHVKYGINADVKLFNERRTNLMSERPNYFDYNPSNDNTVGIQGLEVQSGLRLSPQTSIHAAASYQRIDYEHPLDNTLFSKKIGSMSVVYRPTTQGTWMLAHYYADKLLGYGANYTDVRVAWNKRVNRIQLQSALTVRHTHGDIAVARGDGTRVYTSADSSPISTAFSVTAKY